MTALMPMPNAMPMPAAAKNELARAPAKLSEVLSQLSSGDQVRIWMPKGLGQQVVADAGSRDTIVDLAVTFQR